MVPPMYPTGNSPHGPGDLCRAFGPHQGSIRTLFGRLAMLGEQKRIRADPAPGPLPGGPRAILRGTVSPRPTGSYLSGPTAWAHYGMKPEGNATSPQ